MPDGLRSPRPLTAHMRFHDFRRRATIMEPETCACLSDFVIFLAAPTKKCMAAWVRGYPSDGVAGDSGYFGQLELHKSMADFVESLDAFAFADAGPVVSEDVLMHLGDRFVRGETVADGSGLGLSIVRAIMEQTDGELVLRSPAPDRGDGFQAELHW